MSGGPLDTTIDKSDIEATVAHVFRSRQNASASLKGRGDIAKVLRFWFCFRLEWFVHITEFFFYSRFTGLFFWSLMVVVVLLIFEVFFFTLLFLPFLIFSSHSLG